VTIIIMMMTMTTTVDPDEAIHSKVPKAVMLGDTPTIATHGQKCVLSW
jgi:hypothetical protein